MSTGDVAAGDVAAGDVIAGDVIAGDEGVEGGRRDGADASADVGGRIRRGVPDVGPEKNVINYES